MCDKKYCNSLEDKKTMMGGGEKYKAAHSTCRCVAEMRLLYYAVISGAATLPRCHDAGVMNGGGKEMK